MEKRSLLFGLFMAVLFLIPGMGSGQNMTEKYDLQLKIGNINLQENLDVYLAGFNHAEQETFMGYYFKIVQFADIPLQHEMESMKSQGLVFTDYIPNYAYIIAFESGFNVENLSGFNIRNISDIITPYKLDPLLYDRDYPEHALPGDGYIDLMATFFTNLRYADVNGALAPFVHMVLQEDEISLTQIVRVKIYDIERIAALPFVQYLEPVYPPGEPENYTGKTLHRSNVLNSQYAAGRQYDGEGINVMLQDDGIIGPHIDYEGRIGAQYLTNNSGNHGDHTAGTIFGAGNLDPKTAGMAPGSTLYVYGAAPLYPGFNSIPTHYTTPGIRITSTSYSNGCNAGYTSLARTLDIQINQYPSLMHVFSAGNAGTDNCGYGAGPGWGNVTGGHKVAKNVIAVANVTATDALASSSSRGPAHDGRIKPEISAKGTDVISTINPHTYASFTGTSMSCPGVAGSLAQLYQAYKEINGNTEPKGGLMKAIILNTADDLGNTGPDFRFGFGRINNLRAVQVIEEGRHFTDQITQGVTNTHNIIVPPGVKELRVMVYWTDKEGSIGTNKALVNDINTQLTDPTTSVHYPWVLSHFPHADSLNKPASKGIDNLNNIEQVSVDNPVPGNYSLSVNGFQIPFGPQEYYVVYEFLMNEIVVTYPIGGESFPPGESILVRWDAQGVSGNFTVEYSLDNGQNWTTASSNVNSNLRYYSLSTPDQVTGEALVRVSAGGMSGVSEAPFSIIGVPSNFTFERSCPDAVMIKWNTVNGATSYDVFLLGEKYMEVVGSSDSDSLWVSSIDSNNEYWFSVSANGPSNAKGRRAIAKMKSPGVWNCEFSKDVALTDIISPPLGVLFACQSYNNLNVMVEISNLGQDDMSNITVNYQFNNGGVVSQNLPGTLQAGQSTIYEFTGSTITLPATGNLPMKAWITAPGDQNTFNNTLEGNYKMKPSQIAPVFVNFDFDQFTTCGWDPDCEDVNCYIDFQWFNLENGVNDEIDWRLLNGITPTTNTGPTGDHTLGTIAGRFLYLEPTGECYNKMAILMSPCFDLSSLSSPGLSFWYNMYGADMGSLHIDVVSDGVLQKDVMVPISGDQGMGWKEGFVFLNEFAGKTINLRFRGYTGNGELSDMALDDFIITEMTAVPNVTGEPGFRIYPNPSEGIFTMTFMKDQMAPVNVRIVDMTGRTLLTDQISESHLRNGTFSFDLSGFENGVYFLIGESDGLRFTEKLIRQ
ncbi:MAG: S8 family serine peptidase [Bacteroidales bacterium]